ncbi:MAG: hypothetical protein K9L26_02420, partial [Candidatus Izimaplasma sp.]|nr:hypothetical protein [Candidatus Izimaplasma bacterium]
VDGNPIIDESGNIVYEEVEVPLLDENGDPLIFTEGPIMTEIEEVPIVEYYEVERLDENGDPILDENGNPIYDIVEEPVLDENGDPIYEQREVPVLDENGDVMYQQQFDVELFIEDIIEYNVTKYYANVVDNPLTQLAQRFVDQVLASYYDWHYYRVNNYMISNWGFAIGNDDIYFMEDKPSDTDQSSMERYVMRMSFDTETNELLLEEYINASKAGFDECQIILDPINDNIICQQWDENMKVFSPVNGLLTVPDSSNLNPVTFPNGELYFYDNTDSYIDELGYRSTLLYTINADGTLNSNYIELAEYQVTCQDGTCNYGVSADFYTEDGTTQYNEWERYAGLVYDEGDSFIESADFVLTSVGEFDATRPECTDTNGCWYQTVYEVYDTDGTTLLGTFEGGQKIYPGDDIPPYQASYTVDQTSDYRYRYDWSTDDKICDNYDVGCQDGIQLHDTTINENGIYLYNNFIIDGGETFVSEFVIDETSNAIYNYDKFVEGDVCQFTTCTEDIPVNILDDTGEIIGNGSVNRDYNQDDIIPLHIDYTITSDTVTTVYDTVCTNSNGCWEYYNIDNEVYYNIRYEQGDAMYETITFAETDKAIIESETLTNETCTNIDGCWSNEIEYHILDATDTELYQFIGSTYIEYGYKAPFDVTVYIDDITTHYDKEDSTTIQTCDDATCREDASLVMGTGASEVYLGWGNIQYQLGDQIIDTIILSDTAVPTAAITDNYCQNTNGCQRETEEFTIYDELGNVITHATEWNQMLPVYFAYGERMPIDDDFTATFTLSNVTYRTSRLNVHEFIYNLDSVIVLEEDLYLIERDSWTDQDYNVILAYDDTTGVYRAMQTNLTAVEEITAFGNGYVAINSDETAIYQFTYDPLLSDDNFYYFEMTNLTEGYLINGVNDLIIDYDGSIYFKGVDNFIQDITGTITIDGDIIIDTEYTEREVIRLRPIN